MSKGWFPSDDEINEALGFKEEERSEDQMLDDALSGLEGLEDESDNNDDQSVEGENEKEKKEEDDGIVYEEPDQKVEVQSLDLEEFLSGEGAESGQSPSLASLYDLPIQVRVILGSTEMTIEEILELKEDSVVKLSKFAGEPVEVVIGEQNVAKGEVVVIDDRFGVLITEIIRPHERIKTVERKLRK